MENQLTFNLERAQSNIAALAELRSDMPDVVKLQQYSGWGGLREAIFQPSIYKQLKGLISDADITAIKETVKTAYYTPERLVNFIYQKLQSMQFVPKRILEPSAGHGVFLKMIPQAWQQQTTVTAVEMDSVSCKLLKTLYPNVNVCHQPFEEFISSESFDLIVGNPPYGQIEVKDALNPDLAVCSIHHYFVAKCMRLLKEGGILAMVLPRYFLDAPEKHLRHIIAKEGGSLLEAYRLPDDLFLDAKVTVDLVFLQKKSGEESWVQARPFNKQGKRAHMNTYFFQHPKQVLGNIEFIHVYGRNELTCKRKMDVLEYLESSIAIQPSVTPTVNLASCRQLLEEKLQLIASQMEALRKEEQQLLELRNTLQMHEQQLQALCQQIVSKH